MPENLADLAYLIVSGVGVITVAALVLLILWVIRAGRASPPAPPHSSPFWAAVDREWEPRQDDPGPPSTADLDMRDKFNERAPES